MAPRKIVYMPLDEIIEAERNAKGHDEEGIGASVLRFGFVEPPILDERTGRLVAGHGRYAELKRLRDEGEPPPEGVSRRAGNVWRVPVVRGWASVDDDEALAMGVALNRLVERGGWRRDALYEDLQRLSLGQRGLDGTGFEPADLDDMARLAGPAPDLDELTRDHGTPGERDFWPVVRVQVSPATKAEWDTRWAQAVARTGGSDDVDELMRCVLDGAGRGFLEEHDPR